MRKDENRQKALKRMDSTYLGLACKRGHGHNGKTVRYALNGSCAECLSEKQKFARGVVFKEMAPGDATLFNRMEAAAAREPFYWMTAPCRYGHLFVRYTSTGGCYECSRIRRWV